MPSNDKKQEKLDKRAAALKANMQRRKTRAKELKKNESKDDKPNDEN